LAEPFRFDLGVNARLSVPQTLLLGLQNVFGMTGMFVFPALLGRAFQLAPGQIAYLYGMCFIACGIATILQSVLLLRLPIVQGPYAGSFGAILAIGHLDGAGLGAAYGSFLVAALILCLLSIPVGGRSGIGLIARWVRSPLLSGVMVMLIIMQITSVALPNWIGKPDSPGFAMVNLGAGAITVVALVVLMRLGGPMLRRLSILIALALGALAYLAFRPISPAPLIAAPWLVRPELFPFGFVVRTDLVLIFLLVLIPAAIGSMALYETVAEWADEPLPPERMAQGVLGVAIGAVAAALCGGFSTIAYPDNLGILRATRVGSRYATFGAGLLLIVLGACIKFDMLLVLIPSPVISAAATLLFGIVFMHGVAMLSTVEHDDAAVIAGGLGLLVGLGGLFVSPETRDQLPLLARLILQQPVVSGGVTMILLNACLKRRQASSPTPPTSL
jgi:xanthine/uracil permease